MAKLYNLAAMTVASTGTGTITLGAAATINGVLYLSFAASGVSNGETVAYSINDVGASEVGTGVYSSSGTTLTRTPVTSTNANAAINMTAAAIVRISPARADLANLREANAFTDTTDASSSTTGAMTIAGGLGVAKKLYLGGGFFPGPGGFSAGVAQIYTSIGPGGTGFTMTAPSNPTGTNEFGFYSASGAELFVNPSGTNNTKFGGGLGSTSIVSPFATLRGTITAANGLNSNLTGPNTSYARITGPTGAFSLGGFTAGIDGYILKVYNTVAQTMTIVNEDASSTAGNRIKTLTGGNVVLRATATSFASFIYDTSDSRWILTSTN